MLAPAVRDPGPAGLGVRRHQLHRDVRLPAGHRVRHPPAERALVGAGAAAGPHLPGPLPRLLGDPRAGDPRAGGRRSGLPASRGPPEDRPSLAGCAVRRRLRRAGPGHGRQHRGPGPPQPRPGRKRGHRRSSASPASTAPWDGRSTAPGVREARSPSSATPTPHASGS